MIICRQFFVIQYENVSMVQSKERRKRRRKGGKYVNGKIISLNKISKRSI